MRGDYRFAIIIERVLKDSNKSSKLIQNRSGKDINDEWAGLSFIKKLFY